jgi:protoporphyrinogen oxidase
MKSIVVIGAGPAGLTAAFELMRNPGEYHVVILEESNEIGGISRTVTYNGNRMDIGGHRFFSKNQDVIKWWDDIMPAQGSPSYDDVKLGRKIEICEGGPDPEKEDKVMLIRNRVSRIYYKSKFFDYPISMKPQTFKNMGLATTIKAGSSYVKSSICKLEEDSLENFYINRFGRVLYSMFFQGYTEKLWGRHPRDISADWGSQRVKGLSIMAILKDMVSKIIPKKESARKVETSLIEAFYYPKFGPGQLWETVADLIVEKGGEIRKNCKVTNLNIGSDGNIKSVSYEKNGIKTELQGDIFISSMPVKDLITGMDDTPRDIERIAKGLPYRDFVTTGLLVDRLELKNKTNIKTLGNIVPDCWIYVQDVDVKLGRIQIFNNWSPYMLSDPENKVWIGLEYFCNEGDDFWNMTDQECIDFCIRELISMNIIRDSSVVGDSHRVKVKKAYPAYFDTYIEIDKLIEYLNTFDNLFCIGRNGQHRYNNMDHSMVTAFEAVKNIKSGVTHKDNIWSVNTEKEYHEEQKKK